MSPHAAHHAILTAVQAGRHASQLWPTLGRVGSTLAAIGSAVAALLGARNHRKITEVRVLVNGNLATATREMAGAKAELARVLHDRDLARADLAKLGNRATDTQTAGTPAIPPEREH